MSLNDPFEELKPAELDEVIELETLVHCRLNGMVRSFRLSRKGQGLILRGRARTYYAKQLAQHAIMQATAVPILANEIEVS
jgi:hypothetical protein